MSIILFTGGGLSAPRGVSAPVGRGVVCSGGCLLLLQGCVCSQGVCSREEGPGGDTPQTDNAAGGAVRILLECILVYYKVMKIYVLPLCMSI